MRFHRSINDATELAVLIITGMNTSGKGLVALYLHKRGEQWMVQQIKVLYNYIVIAVAVAMYLICILDQFSKSREIK